MSLPCAAWLLAAARAWVAVDAAEAVEIDREKRRFPASGIAIGECFAQPAPEGLATGQPGERVGGLGDAFLGAWRPNQLHRDQHAGDSSVRITLRARVEHTPPPLSRGILFGVLEPLDAFARQPAPLHFGQSLVTGFAQLVMPAPGQRLAGQIEGVNPGGARRRVAKLAIKQRHRRRDVGDKPGPPIRGGIRLWRHVRSCPGRVVGCAG
jgi:hypothetical protein